MLIRQLETRWGNKS